MYPCPNCAGVLLFDIETQMMKCDHCEDLFHPRSFPNNVTDAAEKKFFEVTTYTCPQCNGEVNSTEKLTATFCVYCGSPVTMTQKYGETQAPDYIIPFMKTKKQCIEEYRREIKRTCFIPKEMKSAKFQDNFIGMYIPYWSYPVTVDKEMGFLGKKIKEDVDNIYESTYQIVGKWKMNAEGLMHDASAAFSDELSERIAPFHYDRKTEFHPAYMAGFYGDADDVPAQLYKRDAGRVVVDLMQNVVREKTGLKDLDITDSQEKIIDELDMTAPKKVLVPIWFMAYRNKKRVSYAAINGETGRIATDLPVNMKMFAISVLLFTIPTFVILSLLVSNTPTPLLMFLGVLSGSLTIFTYLDIRNIVENEQLEFDRGKNRTSFGSRRNVFGKGESDSKHDLKRTVQKKNALGTIVTIGAYGGSIVLELFTRAYFAHDTKVYMHIAGNVAVWVTMAGSLYLTWRFLKYITQMEEAMVTVRIIMRRGFYSALLATLIAQMTVWLNPMTDMVSYAVAFVAVLLDLVSLVCVIQKINILATREIPYFNRKDIGGEHS